MQLARAPNVAAVVDLTDSAHDGLRQTSYDRVRDAIREDIVRGVWSEGARLKIAPLVQRYGLSPAPIREALSRLEAEGLILLHPNRGAQVRPIDEAFIRDLYEIRLALEPMLVARSTAVAGPHHIVQLATIETDYERATVRRDVPELVRLNRLFHRTIYRIRPNTEALRLMAQHAALMGTIRSRFGFAPARLDEIVQEHRRLLEAVRQRDADGAAAIMRSHIEGSIADILERRRSEAS